MEQLLSKLTVKYQGWVIDSFSTPPNVPPGTQTTVIITILSPGPGDQSTSRKKLLFANMVTGDITEG